MTVSLVDEAGDLDSTEVNVFLMFANRHLPYLKLYRLLYEL